MTALKAPPTMATFSALARVVAISWNRGRLVIPAATSAERPAYKAVPSAACWSLTDPIKGSTLVGLIGAVVILVLAASTSISRPGFLPDEEITAVVVNGVSISGVPKLPSGILYLRGLPYTYAAWIGGLGLGQTLPSYRVVSLLFAICAVLLMFCVARGVTTTPTALYAAVLLASSPLHIGSAVFARFYSAFIAAALCAIWIFQRSQKTHGTDWAFLGALVFCRLLHEFAVLLVLLPLCHAACTDRSEQTFRRSLMLFLKSAALMAGLQALLTGLERLSFVATTGATSPRLALFGNAPLTLPPLHVYNLAGPSGLIVIAAALLAVVFIARSLTRAPWTVLAAFGLCAWLFQFGALLMIAVIGCLARPRQGLRILLAGLIVAAGGATLWVLHTSMVSGALLSFSLGRQLVAATMWYPWEGLFESGRTLMVVTTAAGLTATGAALGWMRQGMNDGLRVLALFSLLTFAALGVSALELHWRYILLATPPLFLLAAHFAVTTGKWLATAIPSRAISRAPLLAAPTVTAVLIVGCIADQYVSASEPVDSLPAEWMLSRLPSRTETAWRRDFLVDKVGSDDLLICNDELACQHLAGRVDYWLLPPNSPGEGYAAGGLEGRRGFYAGSPVIADSNGLHSVIECSDRPVSIVVLNTGKFDYSASHALALQMATRFRGVVISGGRDHLIVRFERQGLTQGCKGGGS